ncbi:MAG: hypothetical protein M1834_001938 [Cirrosporium novae-zelandiae]|nr:MAG: hypothetical protein M1834_001938 [Cirrosporium novae-zelandiae]
MGFTSGFFGGLTLTTGVLYLSLAIHRQNRQYQSALLRQQVFILNSIVEPLPEEPAPPRYIVNRTSLIQTWKDGWNNEVTKVVRSAQETDWGKVRDGLEDRIGSLWKKAQEKKEDKS